MKLNSCGLLRAFVRPALLLGLLMLGLLPSCLEPIRTVIYQGNFAGDFSQWVVEQMPGGTVRFHEGALEIDDDAGCTVWFREKLTGAVIISYDATVVQQGGPHDRVSDLNCFWMATDPGTPDGCPFAPAHGRSGKFADYDSLLTYYVGYGGNTNTTTRFRRYDGTPARPLLPEHDLRDKQYLLAPNQTYHLKLVAQGGTAEFWRDGKKIFTFHDPAPLTGGWFGFRTVNSHLEIRNFHATQTTLLPADPKP